MENSTELPEKQKPKTIWIVLGIVLIFLLSGAALVGGKLLGKHRLSSDVEGGNYIQAEGLPVGSPEMTGMVKEVGEDGGIFAQEFSMNDTMGLDGGSGGMVVMQGVSSDGAESALGGEVEVSQTIVGAETDGPMLEVVVRPDTQIYKDVTPAIEINVSSGGDEMPVIPDIQQEIAPGKVSEITEGSILNVWGERRGDRIIADFILFTNLNIQ